MKIVFIYTDKGAASNRFNQGIAQVSACLKESGHQTALLHIYDDIDEAEYASKLKVTAPDLVAFSSISNLYPEVKRFAQWTKQNLDVRTIYGGVHPSLAPEECINIGLFDFICVGEGDEAVVELCNKLERNEDTHHIKNIWAREDGNIYRNPARPLIEDLDVLPPLDYDLFNYETLMDATYFKRLVIMASRGCAYACTYCCNHRLRELYPNKARYVRYRSADRVIEQIEQGLEKFPFVQEVRFFDDTLTFDKEWFREFAQKYKERIGLPYSTNDRVNQITPEIAQLLGESGCRLVEFGIESGNPEIRHKIMRRMNTSNEQIIKAFRLCKEQGIQCNAFNIVGVPEETLDSILDTVRLNAQARPDWSYVFYFHPFVGTKLHESCVEKGLLTNKTFKTIYEGPTLNLGTITEEEVVFAFTFFRPLIKLYKLYYRFPKPAFNLLDKATSRLLSWSYFPRATLVESMPYFIKSYDKSLEVLRKVPFLYQALRSLYHSLFLRKAVWHPGR